MKIIIALQACHCLNVLKDAQRQTWMRNCQVEYKFFMGRWEPPNNYFNPGARLPGRKDDAERYKKPEQKADEIWLDMDDRKQELSAKAVEIIRWVFEHGYDYVFKCDIDTYVRTDRLLSSGFETQDYIGFPINRMWRGRRTQYGQGGAGFWMSRDAMKAFLESDQSHIPFEDAEDVRTGWLLREQGVELVHDYRYEPYRSLARAPHPQNDVITTHKCGPEQMHIINRRFAEGY